MAIQLLPQLKKLFAAMLFLACCVQGIAQQLITGTVRDSKGNGLFEVSVRVKGMLSGTTTGNDGSFAINAPANAVLIFSHVGLTDQELALDGRSVVNVVMDASNAALDAVVVVGYGTTRRRDLTGSVTSVSSDKINAFPSANVMQALSGRAPGVQVKQNNGAPGAPISIRIRGTNSIVGNNEPLYVVDGFPVSSPDVINNSSIKSIEILKDASATAIYGSRASNGVVLITTMRGAPGKTKVVYQSSYGRQSVIKKMEMMKPVEYANFYNEFNNNMGRPPQFTEEQIKSYEAMGDGTDWQDVVFSKAAIQNHLLNISGGSDKTRFAVTGGVFSQDGIIKNSGYSRYSVNSSLQHAISDKFSVEVNLSLSKTQNRRHLSEQGRFGTSLIGRAYSIPPILPVYNDDGSYMEPIQRLPFVSEALYNPLDFINEQKNTIQQKNLLGTAAISYRIIDGLTLKVLGGVESVDMRSDFYQTKKFQNDPNGMATVTTSDYTSYLNENTLNYVKHFNDDHEINAVAGVSFQNFLTTTLTAGGSAFLSDLPETNSLGMAGVFSSPGSSYTKSVLLSGLGRINYSFKKRYLFTVSMRSDGSSVYSADKKWGYFPSAAFAWRLSDEHFFRNVDVVKNVKLRASWGKAGSQAISPYSTLNTLEPNSTVFGNTLYTTMSPGTRLAADLKWETTQQMNIGFDFTMLNDRIMVSADYYRKKTSDLLNAVQLPRTTGFTNSLRNVGKIANNGFEFDINARAIDNKELKWDIGLNMSFNRSKVLALYGGQDILAGQLQMILFTDFANTYREGEPLGVIYGYKEDGYDEKGLVKYVSTTDKVKIGDPNPKAIFGFNSNLRFKDFYFSMFWGGSLGNDIVNMSKVAFTVETGGGINKLRELKDNHWTPTNTNAKYPIYSSSNKLLFSDRYVEDGSFIRMRNIEIGYDVPTTQWKNFPELRVFVSGQNLLTFSKYSWVDPDVNSRGGANSLDQGIDYSTYPSAKSVTAGVRLGF
ncbi:MAG: TonB-dependent receptor [Flavihumibacter sp.]